MASGDPRAAHSPHKVLKISFLDTKSIDDVEKKIGWKIFFYHEENIFEKKSSSIWLRLVRAKQDFRSKMPGFFETFQNMRILMARLQIGAHVYSNVFWIPQNPLNQLLREAPVTSVGAEKPDGRKYMFVLSFGKDFIKYWRPSRKISLMRQSEKIWVQIR